MGGLPRDILQIRLGREYEVLAEGEGALHIVPSSEGELPGHGRLQPLTNKASPKAPHLSRFLDLSTADTVMEVPSRP